MRESILVADDDTALREMMALTLSKEGYAVRSAASAAEARELIAGQSFDLVVSDIYLGDATAIDLLAEIQSANPEAAIILVTAQGSIETAAAASAAGVFDYLAKPFPLEQLIERVGAALGNRSEQPAPLLPGPESMIIGSHPSIVEVYKAVARVAPLPLPVLIRGETGTGKELVARALHRYGANPDGPFVAVNCGAIPESLLESELFGHRRGAFTGAVRDHRGAIESARDGTLLLDEIGELPPLLQVKLLRFLQEGEIRPVGAEKSQQIPVRVVAATHSDLQQAISTGSFREDFYYRLASYEICLPPLRQRPTDLPLLVEHFRRRFQERTGRHDFAGASEEVILRLQEHPWPGNVRELENLVQRAMVDLESLSDLEGLGRLLGRHGLSEAEQEKPPAIGGDLTLAELERLHIEAVLRRYQGNRSRTAEVLGIERKSLYRKAERLGIDLDSKENEP
jgi:DNA-binding NtrC family response regulator